MSKTNWICVFKKVTNVLLSLTILIATSVNAFATSDQNMKAKSVNKFSTITDYKQVNDVSFRTLAFIYKRFNFRPQEHSRAEKI